MMKSVSFKNLEDNEEVYTVNTPLSLEACYKEGIRPEELLYAPFKEFHRPGVSKEVQQLNYKFFETQRQKLLKIAKNQYFNLTQQKKLIKSRSQLQISQILSSEAQRVKENHLKEITKIVNYKLNNLKFLENNPKTSNIIKSPSYENNLHKETDTNDSTHKNSFKKSLNYKFFSQSCRDFNLKRDADLIAKEKIQQEQAYLAEKRKNIETEIRRKQSKEKLQNNLLKAKKIKEQEDHEKLKKLMLKDQHTTLKIRKIHSSRSEKREKEIFAFQNKFSKVVSSKKLHDEYMQDIRNKIVKEENDKIISHNMRKQKFQEETLQKIKKINEKRDLKSLTCRQNIERNFEEKKEKVLQELKEKQEKIENNKYKENQKIDVFKQKNRLKEIEKE